jgi:aspartyl-tRNA(Asn)/glutamyl-tRNA(Gln) amidotransferase subunit A
MSDWTIVTLAEAIRKRRVSALEATGEALARIRRLDGSVHAFITLDAAGALARARALDDESASGRLRGPLHGVPLAYKDICRVHGLPTSCGTKTADYFGAEHECTAVRRLTAAGAVTLGKLNTSELASGPFGDNAHHGDVQNPWCAGHASGGSSSGAAAAVGAGMIPGALGSDTGGSVRLPAACCGVVGLKPTYGRVSRAGVMPLSWSLDHVGPLTGTVRDAALLLGVIAGHDPLDATSSRHAVAGYLAGLDEPVAGLRVGLPENYYFDGVNAEIETAVRSAARVIQTLGVAVVPLRLPDPEIMVGVCNVISRAESAAVHSRILRERPHELQPVVLARLEVGLHVPAHDYLQALRLRARLTREFLSDVFGEIDVLVAPVIPEPAPAYADVKAGSVEEIVRRMGRFSRLTRPFNGLGLPAMSLPCGFSADGRPLAMQIVGRPFDEITVLRLGHAYEQATRWPPRQPPPTGPRG